MGGFINMLAQQGANLIGQAGSAGMGLLLQGHNDRRQIRQQQKLTDMQLRADQAMTDYQMKKQLEMWEATNYNAQKEQMKKAGLNPALMYGMSGGGGATTGAGAASSHGSQAPAGGGEIMGMMQLRTQQAQINLMEAQAKKAEAEATKTGGADTDNVKADTKVKEWQSKIMEIEERIKNETAPEVIATIGLEMQKLHEEWEGLVRENYVSEQTKETRIKTLEAELISIGLEQALTKANTSLSQKQIWKIGQEVAQGWQKLTIEQQNAISQAITAKGNYTASIATAEGILRRIVIDEGKLRAEGQTDDKEVMKLITDILQAVIVGGALRGGGGRQVIGGFKPR